MDLQKTAAWTLLRWTTVLKHWLHGVNGWPNLMTPAVARNPNSSNSRLRDTKAIERCRNDTCTWFNDWISEKLHSLSHTPCDEASKTKGLIEKLARKTAPHFTACCVVLWQHDALDVLSQHNVFYNRTFTARCACITYNINFCEYYYYWLFTLRIVTAKQNLSSTFICLYIYIYNISYCNIYLYILFLHFSIYSI